MWIEKMEKIEKQKRDTNFELLRILSMVMIIILHFNMHGGILDGVEMYSKKYFFFYFLEYACLIAVNLYVMISGYYMIKLNIKAKKIVEIEFQVLFYSILIYLALVGFNQVNFNITVFINNCFPNITGQYWFITTYMGLYILMPFINKLANNLRKKDYRNLLIILTILFSLIRTVYPTNNLFEANNGYGLIWFIYLYLLAGYIRLHFNRNVKKYKLIFLYISMIIIQIAIRTINFKIPKDYGEFLLSYNSIFTLTETILIFLIFKNINIQNNKVNNAILCISPLMLGVYLIHDNNSFRNILWEKILKTTSYLNSGIKIIFVFIIDILLVFTICCIIEKLRKFLFELIKKCKFINRITERLNKIYLK